MFAIYYEKLSEYFKVCNKVGGGKEKKIVSLAVVSSFPPTVFIFHPPTAIENMIPFKKSEVGAHR